MLKWNPAPALSFLMLLALLPADPVLGFRLDVLRPGNVVYAYDYDPLQQVIGGSSSVQSLAGSWVDIAFDGQDYYGLAPTGQVFLHPGGLGGIQTLYYTIPSTGYTGLAHDGTTFYGLFNTGAVFANPGNLGGLQTLLYTIPSTGYKGLAHDGTQFLGLFNSDAVLANPGDLGGTQILVGFLPTGVSAIALPIYARPMQKLLASGGSADDSFGGSVSLAGGHAIVGVPGDDETAADAGAAFVYRFDGGSWVEEQKLVASDGAADDKFGQSVSAASDLAIVGALQDDDNGADSGAAYVYRFNGTSWLEEQKLLASDGAADDGFGSSLSATNDRAVVGARRADANGSNSGAVYIYRFDGTSWVEEQKLLASDGAIGDSFGQSVSIAGDIAIIGALNDDDNGPNSGAAYIYRFDGTSWVEEQKLLASDGAAGDLLGVSASIAGDRAVVGALEDDDNGLDSGAAYVFRFDGTSWVEEQKLLASDGVADDSFGSSVSLVDDLAIIGSYWDDDSGPDSGTAYIYRFDGASWVEDWKLHASDGAPFDRFGASASLAGSHAIVGAPLDDNYGLFDSGSAFTFDLGACGDAVLDPGEACDDGARVAGDGCGPTCQIEECGNGTDDDGDGLVDFAGSDPGCWGAEDLSERSGFLVCDNGIDDDGDGAGDYPADPGCKDPAYEKEAPKCDDDVDNDADGETDWDGGSGGGTPDAFCAGQGWKNREKKKSGCGLGLEFVLLVPALRGLRRRRGAHSAS